MAEDVILRLRKAGQAYGSYEKIAADAAMPLGTVQKLMRGAVDPRFSTMSKLCRTLGVTLDYLNFGIGPESGDWETHAEKPPVEYLPYYDITVSAGDGVEPLEGEPEKTFAFRIDWLRSKFTEPDQLALVRIEGDSMLPELKPNDLLMVDRSQTVAREGIFVVQIGAQLLVKRVQKVGAAKVKLLSANPVYAPIEVELGPENTEFRIVGRGVWIGRNI